MEDAEERLARLELEIAEMRASVAELKSGKFDVLKLTTGIQLFDGDSNLRAALMLLNGSPVMKFWSKDTKAGLFMGIGDGEPEISLSDSEGNVRLKAKIGSDDEPMLILSDKIETPRVSLSVIDNTPRLMLHDADHNLRIVLSTYPEPYLQICDEAENPRVLVAFGGGKPEICILDAKGRRVSGL